MPEYYKASVSDNQGRKSFSIIFRHPVFKDKDGKYGLRIRRGLGTNDEAEANRLVAQMNEILSNDIFWEKNAQTIVATKFDPRVVSAFYDMFEVSKIEPRQLREEKIPLGDSPKTLIIGTTGAGKTTLLRQLIGSPKSERFPSTSAAKTTTSEIEIITRHERSPFEAVVSFMSKDDVRLSIEECLMAAASARWEDKSNEDIAARLLEHSDQRFRLSYILGTLPIERSSDLEDEEEEQEESEDTRLISFDEKQQLVQRLSDYIARIRDLADTIKSNALETFGYSSEDLQRPEDREAFQELLEGELVKKEQDQFYLLTDDILEDIKERFNQFDKDSLTFDQDGWPVLLYLQTDNSERSKFLDLIKRFSSNYAPNFGKLLTPIVQGLRVAGPFKPSWAKDYAPVVLIDGEGLGHTPDTASAISTRITDLYKIANHVLLVDNAAQPMLTAPATAIHSLFNSGNISKLVICFTHFDDVKGDNLPNSDAKIQHVYASLGNVINDLGKRNGTSAEKKILRYLDGKVFYVSKIQEAVKETKHAFTVDQLRKLLNHLSSAKEISLTQPGEIVPIPVYNDAALLFQLPDAIESFRDPWRARLGFPSRSYQPKEHWASVKAFTRRLSWGWEEYFGRSAVFQPVADLLTDISATVAEFLENPEIWKANIDSIEQKDNIIEKIKGLAFEHLREFARAQIVEDNIDLWLDAFSKSGRGSSYERAYIIERIFDKAAPTSEQRNPNVTYFFTTISFIVRQAILEGGGQLLEASDTLSPKYKLLP